MHQGCYDTYESPIELLYIYPISSLILLIAIGMAIAWLWMQPKWKSGRIISVSILCALGAWLLVEPVKQEVQNAAVAKSLEREEWKKGRTFEVRDAATRVVAYALPAGISRECNSGFIVEMDSIELTDDYRFTRGYPNSPFEYHLQSLSEWLLGSHNFCTNRATMLYGDHQKLTRPNTCLDEKTKIEFFEVDQDRDRGFTMHWCRKLDFRHAYCEAQWADVLLASGNSF